MKKQFGFTLIEVMIVVVIVAILAAVAIPSYQNSVQKTRRADAKEALLSAAALQERYFFSKNAYANSVANLGVPSTSSEGHYTISIGSTVLCGTDPKYPCYTITATATGPQLDDTQCRTFTVTQTGKKASKAADNSDTTDICWK